LGTNIGGLPRVDGVELLWKGCMPSCSLRPLVQDAALGVAPPWASILTFHQSYIRSALPISRCFVINMPEYSLTWFPIETPDTMRQESSEHVKCVRRGFESPIPLARGKKGRLNRGTPGHYSDSGTSRDSATHGGHINLQSRTGPSLPYSSFHAACCTPTTALTTLTQPTVKTLTAAPSGETLRRVADDTGPNGAQPQKLERPGLPSQGTDMSSPSVVFHESWSVSVRIARKSTRKPGDAARRRRIKAEAQARYWARKKSLERKVAASRAQEWYARACEARPTHTSGSADVHYDHTESPGIPALASSWLRPVDSHFTSEERGEDSPPGFYEADWLRRPMSPAKPSFPLPYYLTDQSEAITLNTTPSVLPSCPDAPPIVSTPEDVSPTLASIEEVDQRHEWGTQWGWPQ
jgi:hypothetical protein